MTGKEELTKQLEDEVRKNSILQKELNQLRSRLEDAGLSNSSEESLDDAEYHKRLEAKYLKDDILKVQTMALEAAANAIVIADSEGDIIWINPAFTKLTGYELEEVVGRNPRVLKSGRHDASFYQEMWETICSGKVWKNELVNKRKDDSVYQEEMIITPVMGKDNKPQSYIAIKHDVTNRKKKEKELEKLNRSLEQTADRANQMAKKAQQASQAKSEFLATMSHEIRTPMNGIIGMTNLLLDTKLDQTQKHLANAVMVSANSLLAIINDILDFSKIEAGKFELEPIAFDLYRAIEAVGNLLSVRAKEQKIDFVLKIEPGTPQYLIGDVGRIQQTLTNLISNAIKFTLTGYVLVKVSVIEATDSVANILFSVEDTGVGIAPERLNSIFEIFTQADSSTTREFGGTGLGLTISKKLVNLMGGEIEVRSTLRQGSIFTFNTPLELDTEKQSSEELLRDKSSSLKTKILYAANADSISRTIVERYFSAWNMPYDFVDSSFSAKSSIKARLNSDDPYHIFIVESSLSDCDIQSLLASIVLSSGENVPAILMLESTSSEWSAIESHHITGIIRSPFHPSMLLDSIQDAEETYSKLKSDAEEQETEKESYQVQTQFKARILLAEDHPINQRVAVMELEKMGCRVEVAENGIVAVNMFRKVPYDVVIMDINMPEMDGYEATRRIRKLEKEGNHIPIIAMTANAMQGDKEKCLEAGMDDYISKPVHRSKLREALKKWVAAELVEIETVEPEISIPAESASSRTHSLLPVFDFDGAIARYDNDVELLEDIAKDFVVDAKNRIEDIRLTIVAGDCRRVGEMSHALKGGSSYVGAERLREAAFKLEEAGKNEKTELFDRLFASIKNEYKDYESILSNYDWETKKMELM